MTGRTEGRLVMGLWVVTVAGLLAPLAFSPPPAAQMVWGIAFAAIPSAGAFILLRSPGNRVGWLLLASGPLLALGMSGQALARLGLESSSDWAPYPLLVGSTALMASAMILPFIPLRFPDGTLPSSRWRIVERLGLLGLVSVAVGAFLFEGEIEPMNFPGVLNPISFPGSATVGDVLSWGALVWLVAAVGMVASTVFRSRRARGDERQQLKWLSLAAIWFAIWMVLFLTNILPVSALPFFGTVNALLLATAITIAVLKYRLYDIDVVISKTLVFGGLAGFITVIYVGIVVGLGTLLGAGDEPNLALSVVATAVVAVAFQPARERLTRLANRLVFGHRATPYEVLSRFAGDLVETATPARTLERMAKLVADGTGADRVVVWLQLDEGMRPIAVWPEVLLLEPIHDRRLSGQATFGDFDHVEQVTYDGQVLGAITLTEPRGESLNHTEQELLRDLAGQAALVLRNLRLTEELRERIEELHRSRERIVRAQDAERRRLERDLHDGAQQQLANLTHSIERARAAATGEGAERSGDMLRQVAEDGRDAIDTIRDLAHGIYPPLLAAGGLARALIAQAAKAAVPVAVEPGGIGRYGQDVEAAAYFCVLEAIQNASKYAHPTQVTVRLREHDGQLVFEVTDDGTGFDPATTAKGAGTTNMTDRLDALHGHLEITSSPEAGTTVTGAVPITSSRKVLAT